MKYFYRNFEFLHPLVVVQFDRTGLKQSVLPYLTNTYARKLAFSLKVAETAHLYFH